MIGIAIQRSMRFTTIFLLSVFLFIPYFSECQIVINEIMAANATSLIETDYYNFPDWLEVYHNGSSTVMLSDYFLSDDINELKKWQFPYVSLSAGQYYVVYCDKIGTGRHTAFGLNADGETIFLSDKSGSIIDQVTYGKQFPDISYGRNPSDQGQWSYCSGPTPGGINTITTATLQSPKAGYSVPAGRQAAVV